MTEVLSTAEPNGWRARAEAALGAYARDRGDGPAAWAEGFRRLRAAGLPAGFPSWASWERLLNDGERFVSQWGDDAAEAGWTARELFSLHPTAPLHRVDQRGAAFLIGGGLVLAVAPDAITLRPAWSKAVLTVVWRWCVGERPAWDVFGAEVAHV